MKNDLSCMPTKIAFFGLLLAVIVFYILLNSHLGLSFPTPWPDEAHFLWQAHAFATNNSLLSPVLDGDRTIMWMPPGYMVLIGLYFKIVGTSLEAARLVSLLTMIAFFILLVRLLTYYGHRWLVLVLASLFLLNARLVACGNIARMESLLLVAVAGGFLLIQRGRLLFGLLVLVLIPILHFNGFYFLLAGLLYVWYKTSPGIWRGQLDIYSIAAVVGVLCAWIAYGLLIATNWDSFINDMGYQFERKGGRSLWYVLKDLQYQIDLAVFLLGGVYAYRSKIRGIELLFLALPAWIIWPIGREIWYEVIQYVGYLVISVFVLHVWSHLISTAKFLQGGSLRAFLSGLFFIVLLGWNFRYERIENMFRYPKEADLSSMDMRHDVPYITKDDRTLISEMLSHLSQAHNGLCVEFEPEADALLFVNLEREGVTFTSPMFRKPNPELVIVHISRHLPTWWRHGDVVLDRAGMTRDSVNYIWYERDRTERWYVRAVSEKTLGLDLFP